MAMELFGMDIAHYAAVSIVISFFLSGHRSVFPSQKLAMKKSDLFEIEYGEDIEHTRIELNREKLPKINNVYFRIQRKRLRYQQKRKRKHHTRHRSGTDRSE
jgi:hypothetical protein